MESGLQNWLLITQSILYLLGSRLLLLPFPGPTNLSSPESLEKCNKWKENSCQPNFRKNTIPKHSCGPFRPTNGISMMIDGSYECCNDKECSANLVEPLPSEGKFVNYKNLDTISLAVIDKARNIAVGTSTNGATFKIPGRVGDDPIPGSSSYADGEVGACGETVDGDIMMRFLPCYQVVESMRLGMNPKTAAEDAISCIAHKFRDFVGAVFTVKKGVGINNFWKFWRTRHPDRMICRVNCPTCSNNG